MKLRRVRIEDLGKLRVEPIDGATLLEAGRIVDDVRARGWAALDEHARRLGDGEPRWIPRAELEVSFAAVAAGTRELLKRTASRIARFAAAQRSALTDLTCAVDGGRAGHDVLPVESAGCYAPGGRFPLPSSVLMTAVTARAAGVGRVIVASPRPAEVTLVAAYVGGADGVLAAGGAQAIGALAFGAGPVDPCDVVVGPGNRWVTAAKQRVAGFVGLDMLAGPSELVVVADAGSDPALVAADLLAQAEHDTDALPVLVSLDAEFVERVEAELELQLATLPTAAIARAALANGFAIVEADTACAARAVNQLAPEHLQIVTRDPRAVANLVEHAGAVFLGPRSAEVLGDYGAGPNHVLPTSRAARSRAGLSVFTFLRARTWLDLDDPEEIARDAAALARLEGLEGHARAAERRCRA
ncbi:MAG: histidinol dehydrogenase [Planctomycetota bacterium]|nr:histidinol dehydrogenase [Planctomycetota bacterium]